MKFWRELESILTGHPSTDTVFNQYRDCDNLVDVPTAPLIRTANLRAYMEKAGKTATVVIVGEAAGPWGCRFSGVPFTGERQLLDPSFPFQGSQSSRAHPPHISRTATMFWEIMLPYYDRFVAWDAFPLYPHKQHDLFSVRNPTKSEVSQFGPALRLLIQHLAPTRLVAVGRAAEKVITSLGEVATYVRHPSQGGKAAFTVAMQRLLGAKR